MYIFLPLVELVLDLLLFSRDHRTVSSRERHATHVGYPHHLGPAGQL
jgi:hypothetical protein